VSSIEALVRWHSPERGSVPPATFIPIAEDTGLIVELGEWILNTACRQTVEWHDKGLGRFRIAVNLSPAQFRSKFLKESVENALQSSGLPPDCLELELTESILMEDVEGSAAILQELTELGVSVAVDDFGVGYSSLTQLKRFPVSALKIDRSFVNDMVGSADDSAIVAATIALGHSLRLNVVAEGVEKMEQLAFLREHKCDESQGFLFSKPVSGSELEEWLNARGRSTPDTRALDAD
jgi:EAL domain-containing protein (putative c-di-GMP-specific phosphodiesterase class I)